MYSFMCYFLKMEHIAHYKAKNQNSQNKLVQAFLGAPFKVKQHHAKKWRSLDFRMTGTAEFKLLQFSSIP